MRWLVTASLMLCGCGDLLGASDYRILEPTPNRCGPLEVPTENGCQRAGATDCGPSFIPDPSGGCEPVLPAYECSPNADGDRRFAHPGNTKCSTAGLFLTCPSNPDPLSYPDNFLAGTRYVWADAPNPGAGSRASPHATVTEAVAAASPGEVILVAPGIYAEHLLVDKPLRIHGVCGPGTVLSGSQEGEPTIAIATGSNTPVTFVGLGIQGAGPGIVAKDSALELEDVWIDATGGPGIELYGGGANLSRLLVQNTLGAGILAWGSTILLVESHIRDIATDAARLRLGDGLAVFPGRHGAAPDPGHLTVDRVLIERARHAGIRIEGSEALVVDSVVRDMEISEDVEPVGLVPSGFGISVAFEVGRKLPGRARVEQSLVEGAWGAGLRAFGASLEVAQTTVRQTRAVAPPCRAHALRVIGARTSEAEVQVSQSLLEDSRGTGAHVLGGDVLLTRTIIRGTDVEPCGGQLGDGVGLYEHPDTSARPAAGTRLSIQRSLIEGHRRAAAMTFGGTLVLDRSLLRDSPKSIWSTAYQHGDALQPVPGVVHFQGTTHCEDPDGLLRDCDVTGGSAEPDLFARDHQGARLPTIGVGANLVIPIDDLALAGATTWLMGRDDLPLSVTDDGGHWELRAVPANTQILFAASARGFVGSTFSLKPGNVGANPENEFLFPLAVMAEFEQVFDQPIDYAAGLLHISSVQGLVVTVDPPSAIDPVYLVEDFPQFEPSPEASDTIHVNLPAGVSVIRFETVDGAPASCDFDLPGVSFGVRDPMGGFALPIVAGMTNRVGLPLPCSFD